MGRKVTRFVLSLIAVATVVAPSALASTRAMAAPRGGLVAVIVGHRHAGVPGTEDVVLIRRGQAVICRKSFVSADGEHGFGILHAAWTPDGAYFVFGGELSGGHQPWHRPTYVYIRRTNRIVSLDDYVGGIDSDFTLVGHDGLRTTHINPATATSDPLIVHLHEVLGSRHLDARRSRHFRHASDW
jgi:hypothetical protein